MKKKPIAPNTKYGRWVVLYRIPGLSKSNHLRYMCKCSCGTIKPVLANTLHHKESLSCGCLRNEQTSEKFFVHGFNKHRLYKMYRSMLNRCYNKNGQAYLGYGGRGIIVCKRWHNISNFIKDNESKAKPGLTIDRIDNNGPYSPENVRWVDRHTQSLNRRSSVIITHNGESQPLSQWARNVGISPKTLWARIRYRNWPIDKALSTPVRCYSQRSLTTQT